jgi:hypothetical protein
MPTSNGVKVHPVGSAALRLMSAHLLDAALAQHRGDPLLLRADHGHELLGVRGS